MGLIKTDDYTVHTHVRLTKVAVMTGWIYKTCVSSMFYRDNWRKKAVTLKTLMKIFIMYIWDKSFIQNKCQAMSSLFI